MADAIDDKIRPHDIEAERAVLGSCLLYPDAMAEAEGLLGAEDFYAPIHATIFAAMRAVSARHEALDLVTVAAELRSRQRLSTVGGSQYLAELTDTIPTDAHLTTHARIVRGLRGVRDALDAAHEVEVRGYGMRGAAEDFLDWAGAKFSDLAIQRDAGGPVDLCDALSESYARIERLMAGKESALSVPWSRLNGYLDGGFRPGELIIVAARPSVGKTALALRMLHHAARSGTPALMFSVEMSRVELANRLLAAQSGVAFQRIRAGVTLTAEDLQAISDATQAMHSDKLRLDDSGEQTLATVRARSRRQKQRGGLCMVGVDYLQLMHAGHGKPESREREVAEISRGLKALAKELDVPVVACAQLNRNPDATGKVRRPRISDLRESGSQEQDADIVILMHREADDPQAPDANGDTLPEDIEVIIAKQRNGRRNVSSAMKFHGATMSFHECDPEPKANANAKPARRRRAPPPDVNHQEPHDANN